MAVKQDCPVCGRKGNEGHICKGEDDNLITDGIVVAGAAALGGVFGGPVGAVALAVGAGKLVKFVNRLDQKDSDGFVNYRFNCMNPNCKHTWVSKIKE